MILNLVAINAQLVDAWNREFVHLPDVHIYEGNILMIAENTIVSPANSYGLMDGGIDDQYVQFFGPIIQGDVQKAIHEYCRKSLGYDHLPVGASVFVETGNKKIPYMISAPTMVNPGPVGMENCFFAMAAILNEAWRHRDKVKMIYCPGLATGTGRVPYDLAAKEMANAYRKWHLKIKADSDT